MSSNFASRLTGGHPNSLGNTVEIVSEVLDDKNKFQELFECYFSKDETVKLRVSNAMKRIAKEQPEWVAEYLDKFLNEITEINQASAQWTLAQLFLSLEKYLTPMQKIKAMEHMKHNLASHTDWIVLMQTMKTLFEWAKKDEELQIWLQLQLKRLSKDPHKSISRKATKLLDSLMK